MAGAGGVAHIPWYATLFRGDQFETALAEIAPVALRYGATDFHVYRFWDDRYKFMQLATFPDKRDFERYWYGPDFSAWRATYSSWYQIPVLYGFTDLVTTGKIETEAPGEERGGPSPAVA